MPKTNKTEYALLGLLALGPKSGYDVKTEADAMLSHFWHESFGQIYPRLKRLHEKGFVEKEEIVQEGKPNRYVYTLTAAGRGALETWLRQPVEPIRPRNELLLKVFFGRFSDPVTLSEVVTQYQAQLQDILQTLDHIAQALTQEANDAPDLPYWMLTLDSGRLAVEAQLEWCGRALATLAPMADTPPR